MHPALDLAAIKPEWEGNGLAGDPLASEAFLPSLVQFQCRRCYYLTSEGALIDRRRRCPHCKQPGERRLFPSLAVLSSCELLRAIYATARRQRGTHVRAFARGFRKRFGCTLSDGTIAELAERVAGSVAEGAGDAAYAVVAEALSLPDEEELQAAYGRLLLFGGRSQLDAAVVMLACAILRDLVREVLAARLTATGVDAAEAAARLAAATDLAALERLFAEITRRSLRDELEQRTDGDFAAAWWRLSEGLHRGTPETSPADADTAFRLVAESAAPIAELANAVVAGRKQFHPRRPRRGAA